MASERQQSAGYSYSGAGPGRGTSKGGPSISGGGTSHKGMRTAEVTKAIERRMTSWRDLKSIERDMEEVERRRTAQEKAMKTPHLPEGWTKPNPLSEKMQARRDLLANARAAYGPPKSVKTSKVSFSEALRQEAKVRERQERQREMRDYQDRRSRGEREA